MEINSEATCSDCPYYQHMEDADFTEGDPVHPITHAWGHCMRYPHWERKAPTAKACGEHPKYFVKPLPAHFSRPFQEDDDPF